MTSSPRWTTWIRWTAWYTAAWSPLVLVYASLIGASGNLPAGAAISAAFTTVAWAAVLGVGALRIAQRWTWPARPTVWFVLVHAAMALIYAGLWDAFILLGIRQSVSSWQQVGEEVSAWIHW